MDPSCPRKGKFFTLFFYILRIFFLKKLNIFYLFDFKLIIFLVFSNFLIY